MALAPLAYHGATLILAASTPPSTSNGGEGKKASALGLAVILLLCVACYFLFRSMSRHMRKVQGGFSGATDHRPSASSAPSVSAAPPAPSAREAAKAPFPESAPIVRTRSRPPAAPPDSES